MGLRLSERQAKFFNAHFMRDGKRTTAGDLFRDWYPHAACAEAGLRSSKYDLQVLSSLKEAILVVSRDFLKVLKQDDVLAMDVGLRLWLERDGKLEVIEVGQDRERKKVVGVDIAILECNTDGPRIEYGLVRSQ